MPRYVNTVQAPQDDKAFPALPQGVLQPVPYATNSTNEAQYTNQKQENDYVPHTQMDPTGHTPSYWRLFASASIMRYGFEWLRDVNREHAKPSGTENKVEAKTAEIMDQLREVGTRERGMKQLGNYGIHVRDKADLFNKLEAGAKSDLSSIENNVYNSVRQHEYAHYYDRGLGFGSAALTTWHAYGTAQNIKKLYAETVALEFGKRPEDIDFSDIARSKNEVVQNTLHNAVVQNAARYASDAVFFGRSLGALEGVAPWLGKMRSQSFAAIGLALKGMLLVHDIERKQSTVFEALTGLIDKKINSVHGMADSINTGDVIDIYQKYATFAKPDNAFLDVMVRQHSDMDMDWPKSERMFGRIADLMNQTYKYKKSSLTDEERHRQSVTGAVDFALPKYVHLLGQGMIDPTKPEQTMTLVEIAARRDMQALNEAVMMFKELRASPEEVAARYGVEDKLFAPNTMVGAGTV